MLLGAFAVAVLVGAGYVVKQSGAPLPAATTVGQVRPEPTGGPTATPLTTPSSHARAVLLLGPDLARLGPDLARATGDAVEVRPELLTPAAATGRAPDVVVLEILAGTRTGVRTTEAVKAVRTRWPSVTVVLVGPFSSADRKSAAAVKNAARVANALFLDPVELQWRADSSSATVAEADFRAVATQLAAALP